jgi:hypothetical protein
VRFSTLAELEVWAYRLFAGVVVFGLLVGDVASAQQASRILVTNNDVPGPMMPATLSFFQITEGGELSPQIQLRTGGHGGGGGDFAPKRILPISLGKDICIFASNAQSGDIVGVSAMQFTVTGTFFGRPSDSGLSGPMKTGTSYGIGLAANNRYLYASYAGSGNIGTFEIQPGCKLNFLDDTFTVGLNNGWVTGMAVRGALMVVSYGDGSIESFDVSHGEPVSNRDVQYSSGFQQDYVPTGVAITSDGHFAIFGDSSTVTTVEVSNISSGKLTKTLSYNLGGSWNSCNLRLSPDESVLYITNNSSGQVTAAFFNKLTGKLTKGCSSAPLKGFYGSWSFAGGVALQMTVGTGGLLYVPEIGSSPAIGVMQFTHTGNGCSLSEVDNSPIKVPGLGSVPVSIAIY